MITYPFSPGIKLASETMESEGESMQIYKNLTSKKKKSKVIQITVLNYLLIPTSVADPNDLFRIRILLRSCFSDSALWNFFLHPIYFF